MSDLIDRQAAIDAVEKLHIPEDMCVFEIVSHIELAISTLPSAQPERKTGRWIVQKDASGKTYGECSACHYKQYAGMLKYCPECGAKMEVEHDV